MKWSDYEKDFDELVRKKDIDGIYYFLRDLNISLNVCTTSECKIFPELSQLNRSRDALYQDASGAYDENRRERDIMNYIHLARRCLDKIYALYTTRLTNERERQMKHDRLIEVIKELNNSNLPIPFEISGGIQTMINETASEGMGVPRDEFKRFISEYRKKKGGNVNNVQEDSG